MLILTLKVKLLKSFFNNFYNYLSDFENKYFYLIFFDNIYK